MSWYKKVSIIEKRMNANSLLDFNKSIYERAFTFDGAPIHTKKGNILLLVSFSSKETTDEINRVIEEIGFHIRCVSMGKAELKSAVFYFKTNENNKLNLLFCSFIDIETGEKSNDLEQFGNLQLLLNEFKVPQEAQVEKKKVSKFRNGSIRKEGCIDCLKRVAKEILVHLKYKYIIKRHETERAQNLKNPQNLPNTAMTVLKGAQNLILEELDFVRSPQSLIPPQFRLLYPRMKYEEYLINLTSDIFLDKTLVVCSDCYMTYVPYFGVVGGLEKVDYKETVGQIYRFDMKTGGAVGIKKIEEKGGRTKSAPLKRRVRTGEVRPVDEKKKFDGQSADWFIGDDQTSSISEISFLKFERIQRPRSEISRVRAPRVLEKITRVLNKDSTENLIDFVRNKTKENSRHSSNYQRSRFSLKPPSPHFIFTKLSHKTDSTKKRLESATEATEIESVRNIRISKYRGPQLPSSIVNKTNIDLKKKYIRNYEISMNEREPIDPTCFESSDQKPFQNRYRVINSTSKSKNSSSPQPHHKKLNLFFKKIH